MGGTGAVGRNAALGLALALVCASLAQAQTAPQADMPGMDMSGMDMSGMDMSGHDMSGSMAGMTMNPPEVGMAGVSGSLGFYPFTREGSGTAWQPDLSPRAGLRLSQGPWLVILQGQLAAGYDHQDGARGGQGGLISGLVTAQARRDFDNDDALQLRVRVSPDGVAGHRWLLAPGDRQAPHDLLEELSASYSHRLDAEQSLFIYGALAGQPAFGPPDDSQRASAVDNPQASLTRLRQSSTDVAAGVVTAGWSRGDWRIEASGFGGRAPDPYRGAVPAPRLDSASVRLSVNPAPAWALQASWATVNSPLAIAPLAHDQRWSVSALYTRPVGDFGLWSNMAAATGEHRSNLRRDLDAWTLESAYRRGPWTVFARAEQLDVDDLAPTPRTVRQLSLGGIHDWRAAPHLKVGLGALYAFSDTPSGLQPAYGAAPGGALVFLRLKLG